MYRYLRQGIDMLTLITSKRDTSQVVAKDGLIAISLIDGTVVSDYC